MKKLLFLILFVPVLIGCSSKNIEEQTIQMNDVKWSCVFDFMTEEEISKQKSLFELVPGPHKFTVTIENNPGETWYYYDLYLKVRLNRSVDIDISKILADEKSKSFAMSCAGIQIALLDRNGEKIKMGGRFGGFDSTMYLFHENWENPREDFFIDYLTFLKSEPGTVFTLHAIVAYNEQENRCSVGLDNLINEVKGVEIQIGDIDSEFEKYVGEIK
jgi:hypothetical protein